MDGPACIRNSNRKVQQFPWYGGLRNVSQPDQTAELSVYFPQDVPGAEDSDQESAYSEYSDPEPQEPRSNTNTAWQDQTPLEGPSLNASYNTTPLEEDKA